MYRENFMNSLREELLSIVKDKLTPLALSYGYSEVPLETNIKWRPQVLVLGNYSSGKSTLINEFLGADIQDTGQAPTDDSFTIITYDESAPANSSIHVTEERDGKFLLNDPEYPFETLKKHGQRFTSHFRLKKVNSPFLKNLSIIDTPGMVDSITERDRGYNYQEVIGDLAQIADLVLVLFDPHKAGTIREAHISLRDTLPSRTFEDRVLFVLNRIDECDSLIDLLRVYGTLCWNLSQITGRKDIPMIHLTYSSNVITNSSNKFDHNRSHLSYLENQRDELKKAVLQAPRYRLDHLATFVETHGERISHLLEALISYRKQLRLFRIKYTLTGIFISLIIGNAVGFGMIITDKLPNIDQYARFGGGGILALVILFLWMTVIKKYSTAIFNRKRLSDLDKLTPLENQTRRDSWQAIRNVAYEYIKKTSGKFSLKKIRREYQVVCSVCERGSKEIREALNELSNIR
ncbi:MAG: dynamin family protein [Desulfobacterales bacterium]|nr:dynamin family protein [Desulfobacterales bacterium]